MAPTPVENKLPAEPSTTSGPDEGYWSTGNIAMTAVAAAFILGVVLAIVAFLVHRRRQYKKLAQSIPAKESLLASEERKSNMFSRARASSVTVYVDNAPTETSHNPISPDPAPLVPLHINTQIPVPSASTDSGISSLSRNSRSSLGSTMLSPASEGPGVSRPRSTSYSSLRYYAVTPADATVPIPAASTDNGARSLSRNSRNSLSSMMMSPVSEGSEAPRPRSTSYSSLRYYAVTPANTAIPVPQIIRTVSE